MLTSLIVVRKNSSQHAFLFLANCSCSMGPSPFALPLHPQLTHHCSTLPPQAFEPEFELSRVCTWYPLWKKLNKHPCGAPYEAPVLSSVIWRGLTKERNHCGSVDVPVSPGCPSQDTSLEGCGTPPALCRDNNPKWCLSGFPHLRIQADLPQQCFYPWTSLGAEVNPLSTEHR